MNFRTKVFCLSVSGIVATGLISIGVVIYERGQLKSQVSKQIDEQGRSECAKIAKDVYLMLEMEEETQKNKVADDLNVASLMLEQAGGISFADEKIKWNAVNQLTKGASRRNSPKCSWAANGWGKTPISSRRRCWSMRSEKYPAT